MQDQQSPTRFRRTPCVCAAARRTSRALTRFYDLVLAPTGLKATQFIALREIAEAGEIAQWQLSQGYGVATETLSRRLNTARKNGLVEMRRGAKHGERIYRLTVQGQKCLHNAMPYWGRAQRRLAQALGDANLKHAVDILDRVAEAALLAEQIRTPNTSSVEQPRPEPRDTSLRLPSKAA